MSRDERCRTRQETAVAWAGSHAIELAGVSVPLIAGTLFTPWLDLFSAVAAALWVRHELLVHRRTAAARAARAAVLGTVPAARLTGGTETSPAPEAGPREQTGTTPADPAGTEPADGAGRRREVSR
jgi:hypothetical protein